MRGLKPLLYLPLDALRAAIVGLRLMTLPIALLLDLVRVLGVMMVGGMPRVGAVAYKTWVSFILMLIQADILRIVLMAGILHGKREAMAYFAISALLYLFVSMFLGLFTRGEAKMLLERGRKKREEQERAASDPSPPTWEPVPIQVPADLEDRLKAVVKGQELAIDELARGFRVGAMEYQSGAPLGMFLLVGATGSGKTETAKQLASIMGWPLHREECNQHTSKWSVSRLIGTTPGYVDSERGGSLTNALMASRHGILLLDEIEKATPEVAKVLMTLADEGYITDGMGRVIDARGWLILATSNASQAEIITIIQTPDMKPHARLAAIKHKLKEHWAPEILGRIRGVMAYRPVSMEAMRSIFVDKVLWQAARVGVHHTAKIEVEPSAIALIEDVYTSLRDYGVREIQNYLRNELGLKLAAYAGSRGITLRVYAVGDTLQVAEVKQNGAGPRKQKARVFRFPSWGMDRA